MGGEERERERKETGQKRKGGEKKKRKEVGGMKEKVEKYIRRTCQPSQILA